MVDERDKARARLGLPPLAATPAAAPAPVADEQTKARAMRTPTPAPAPAPAAKEAFAPAGTFIRYDYVGKTSTTGTLRRSVVADGKGGEKLTFATEKNPDYVSGSRGGGGGSGDGGGGNDGSGGGGNTAATIAAAEAAKLKLLSDQEAARLAEEKRRQGQSAYSLLFSEFDRYGMGDLVEPLKEFIQQGLSSSEFTLKLRASKPYQERFAANEQRIAKGLRALSEAEYIGMEDQYQNVMRQYGLPESYYTRGLRGKQEGFEKFLAGDVSAVELEDRIATAQKRVLNANPEVSDALKQFYPEITSGDILAFTLDPKNAIENIKRKVTTAEIGGAAIQAGLGYKGNTPEAIRARAEQLRAAGVTKESAQQGFGTIAGGLQRGSQLASMYGEDPYTQDVAETEVFNIAGAQDARKQRQKITGLEKATFGGQTGISSSALTRDRAGGY